MKLLVITPRFTPEPFTIGPMVQNIASKGHDVCVLTGRPNYGLWRYYDGYEKYFKEEIIGKVKVIRVNERVRKNSNVSLLLNYFDVRRKFKKELKQIQQDFDAVLSVGLSPLFCLEWSSQFCRSRKIPNVLYGLDLWPESFVASLTFQKKSLQYSILRHYSKKLYRGFDEIIYASPSACDYIKYSLKVDTIFHHIYQPCLTKAVDINIVNNHFYRKNGKLHILYCGTIAKFIHLDLMVEAIKLLPFKDKVVFDVVGSGADLEKVAHLVEQYNLSDVVIFHGRVPSEQTISFYTNADILFCPLYWNCETGSMIPQKVIEYFMYGRPILGMIKGDGANLIANASNKNIICDQTPESISRGILDFIKYKDEIFIKCGIENRSFFDNNDRFTLDVVCDELIEQIQQRMVDKNDNK